MKQPATYVPPTSLHGMTSNSIIFCGEQPGKTEVRKRQPFVGPAGQVLREVITSCKWSIQDCYFTNVIKDLDHPLDYYISVNQRSKKVTVTPAGNEYIDILLDELRIHPGKVVLAAGNIALIALTARVGITKWRGSILWNEDIQKYVVPTPHPATVLPPTRVYLNKHLIQHDLDKAVKIARGEYVPTERSIIIEPTFDACLSYLNSCINIDSYQTVDYDIEIYNEQVSCISFAYKYDEAISIPFIYKRGDYFTIEQEAEIMLLIAKLLETPTIRKRGQNIVFDAHFMLRRYGIHAKNLDDTMIAQRILMPDYKMGLDFITSIWTDHPYYKDEGKHWFKAGGAWENLWHYNATDSIICAEAFPKQMKALIQQDNVTTYERQRLLIEVLVYMQEHGIACDPDGIKLEAQQKTAEVRKLQEELEELVGRPININSSDQMKAYFYDELKFPKYKKKGKVSCDETALKRIVRQGNKEAGLVLAIRKRKTMVSRYLNTAKIDPDNRLRCSYNPVGTRYSRLSSSKNIFGTGMNLQNLPDSFKKHMHPDPGYGFGSFDLSQAENRIVAYEGRVHQMINAFADGKDIHSLTGSLISGLGYREVIQQNKDGIYCHLGGGNKTWRFWGKKTNHGLNYDQGYKAFALQNEIPENDGKSLVEAYHRAYPGVRQTYHATVRRRLRETRTLVNLLGRKSLFLDSWGDQLFKEAYSCIPQGTVGDVINERGLEFVYYNKNQFDPIELMSQTHDDIGFQIPFEVPWIEWARMLRTIKTSLEIPLKTTRGIEFVIPADYTGGLSLSKTDCFEIKGGDEVWDDITQLAERLRVEYSNLLEVA